MINKIKPEPQSVFIENGKLIVPENPVIPFIEGDGIGPEIWDASKRVLEEAVNLAYQGTRSITWKEVLAGEKAYKNTSSWLPAETIKAIRDHVIAIKGPLTTPIGEGIRSINVTLRKELDLFVCLRLIRYFDGTPSPMKSPEKVNIVLFRENVEDVYAGMDYPFDSPQAIGLREWLQQYYPDEYSRIRFPESSGLGIKPVSRDETIRMIRAAIDYAIKNKRRKITLVHKGNIMKYTEGAFARWAYAEALQTFPDSVYTQQEYLQAVKSQGVQVADEQRSLALNSGKIFLNEILTDAMFERSISHPEDFDIVVTTNLNGDYLADALAALVGGIGIAPGGNINYESGIAIFEATHGTAPALAGKDMANPCSLLLSGAMLLNYLGWVESAQLIEDAIANSIHQKVVTFDFYEQMDIATLVGTRAFSDHLIQWMRR